MTKQHTHKTGVNLLIPEGKTLSQQSSDVVLEQEGKR